jgi:hypothetical protein
MVRCASIPAKAASLDRHRPKAFATIVVSNKQLLRARGQPVGLAWAPANNTPIFAVRFDVTEDRSIFHRRLIEHWQIDTFEVDERMDQAVENWVLKTTSVATRKIDCLPVDFPTAPPEAG